MTLLLSASRRARSGSVLLATVPVIVLMVVTVLVVAGLAIDTSKTTDRRVDVYRATAAAETATQLAVTSLWSEFQGRFGSRGAGLTNLRAHLDSLGIRADAEEPFDLVSRLPASSAAESEAALDGVRIDSVLVRREDSGSATQLTVTTTASTAEGGVAGNSAESRRALTETYSFEPAPFEGLDFVLLANNISCILCHTTIDNAERVFATDPELLGAVERVRVGSIESLQMRSNPESTIAGTLYVGGRAVLKDGSLVSNWSGISLDAAQVDANGNIVESLLGALSLRRLSPADPVDPAPLEDLYLDYFAHADDPTRYQVDGVLPDSFPLPFHDDGGVDQATGLPVVDGAGDRKVDDHEFYATTRSYDGALTAGEVAVVPRDGNTLDRNALEALVSDSTTLAGVTDGHVYLHGTPDAPIRIDGDVAVDGDVVISGVVSGKGNLRARGNIYVVGDVTYDDHEAAGGRTFGRSSAGSENLLTLAAGGNVVVADPFLAKRASDAPISGDPSGAWNFTLDQVASFNKLEWMKTQPTLPGRPYSTVLQTVERTREVLQTVEVVETVPVYADVPTGNVVLEPVMEHQQVGTREVPVYETVRHPATEYAAAWTEYVQVGTRLEAVYAEVQVGTREVAETTRVEVGTTTRVVQRNTSYDPPRYETYTEDVRGQVVPQHPNPYYQGAQYVPRFYSVSEDTPIPIHNRGGYFDPTSQTWIAKERAGSWRSSELTILDPADRTNRLLFHADGSRRAVVNGLAPSAGWLSVQTLQSLVRERAAGRDTSTPLTVDAWLYSANSVFGMIPKGKIPGLDGRLTINGALLAADIGLLAPTALRIHYDSRGKSVLDVRSDDKLTLRRGAALPSAVAALAR